jgi:hypothetical protein
LDNSRSGSDVFVKLVALNGATAYPSRQFYLTAAGSFTLTSVSAGAYDIRYRSLASAGLSRSEAINLKEVHTRNGTQFSNVTLTLYKVKYGNLG